MNKTMLVAAAMIAAAVPAGGACQVHAAPNAPDVPVPVPNRGRTNHGLASGQVAGRKARLLVWATFDRVELRAFGKNGR